MFPGNGGSLKIVVIPFRTTVPFWGQTSQISSSLSPTRHCGTRRVEKERIRFVLSCSLFLLSPHKFFFLFFKSKFSFFFFSQICIVQQQRERASIHLSIHPWWSPCCLYSRCPMILTALFFFNLSGGLQIVVASLDRNCQGEEGKTSS